MDSLHKACVLSLVPALLSNEKGHIEVANDAACTTFGRERARLVGLAFSELVAPTSLEALQDAMGSGLGPTAAQVELQMLRHDGSLFPAELSIVRIPEENGVRVWTLVRDLSAREILARSEETFRVLAQATGEVVVLHRAGTVVLANDAATELFGGDTLGRTILDFIAPEARADVLAHAESGSTNAYESIGLRADGTRFPVEARASNLTYRGESLRVVTLRDMTEQRRMERKLATSDRLASIGLLASGVAHEINNPLAYLVLNLELVQGALGQNAKKNEEALGALHQAVEGAERIRVIVDDLRTLASEPKGEQVSTELHRAIELASSVAKNAIRHAATLVVDVADNLWVDAQEGRLAQVFLNLLMNAAQAIPAGEASSNKVSVIGRVDPEDEGWVHVVVRDTGPGIPPSVLPHVFDPFVTTKSDGAGMGLGLSIVHGIVTDSGGTIEVSSPPGQGTTFVIRLVRADPPKSASKQQPKSLPSSEASVKSTLRARILVVEDEPAVRSILERILQRSYDVVVADSGAAAVEILGADQAFDVVVSDLMMPNMSGVQLLELISDRWPKLMTRCVIMSGGGVSNLSLPLGLEPLFLSKPFTADRLLETITDVLARD